MRQAGVLGTARSFIGDYSGAEEPPPSEGGLNDIRFGDKGGSEEFYEHAQGDMNVWIRLDESRKTGRPLSIDEIARQSYPEVTSFRAVLAITDVGSRVEYLHQRGQLTVANLDEIQRDETAVYRYHPA